FPFVARLPHVAPEDERDHHADDDEQEQAARRPLNELFEAERHYLTSSGRGRSSSELIPKVSRKSFVVPYWSGDPGISSRPAILTRFRSISARISSPDAAPRMASRSTLLIGCLYAMIARVSSAAVDSFRSALAFLSLAIISACMERVNNWYPPAISSSENARPVCSYSDFSWART